MKQQACVHVYCGNGKGKTTAALGLAVRAVGRGKKVLIARFLKTDDSGEVMVLEKIPGITLIPCRKSFGFYRNMTAEQKAEAAVYYRELFLEACRQAETEEYGILILDEIMAAMNYRFVDEETVVSWLKSRREDLEVVLTGRDPSEAVLGQADYISEICVRRHPFEKGIPAREGIEY